MNAEKGGGEVKRGRVQMIEYRVQSTDERVRMAEEVKMESSKAKCWR